MDHREIAALQHKWYKRLDEKRMVALVEPFEAEESNLEYEPDEAFDDDDEEDSDIGLIEVPFTWKVCPTCDGKGTHVNPSIDRHGLSREDFDEDPSFAEDYFSGVYDVACAECNGRRVVPEYNPESEIGKQIARREWDAYQEARDECRAYEMGY